MCIYCGTTRHRKIYEKHYGAIPFDESGNRYHIHHIDGNHNNNNPTNLKAVSIKEHYDIHYSQQDWDACRLLAGRLNFSDDIIRNLYSLASLAKVAAGTHNFLGGKIQRKTQQARVIDGTHVFLNGDIQRKTNERRLNDGTHQFLNKTAASERQKQKVVNKTHHWCDENYPAIARANTMRAIADGRHNSTIVRTCPYCNKTGKGSAMLRWHFANCKDFKLHPNS